MPQLETEAQKERERNEHSIMDKCNLFCFIFSSPDDTEACTTKFKISQEIKTHSFKCALLSFILEALSGAGEKVLAI